MVVGAIAAAFAACGDDSGSGTSDAQAAVCSARSDLQGSIDDLTSAVSDLNFGEAQDALGQMSRDVSKLRDAVGKLASEERSQLEGQIDDLNQTLSSLEDDSSLDQLGNTLDDASSQVDDILSTVSSDLDC